MVCFPVVLKQLIHNIINSRLKYVDILQSWQKGKNTLVQVLSRGYIKLGWNMSIAYRGYTYIEVWWNMVEYCEYR